MNDDLLITSSSLRSEAAALDAAHIVAGGTRTGTWRRVSDDAYWALVEEAGIDADPAIALPRRSSEGSDPVGPPLDASAVAAAMRSAADSWAAGRRPVTARTAALGRLESAAQALNAAVGAYIGALDAAFLAGATVTEASDAATNDPARRAVG